MIAIMRDGLGVGLAATQVGILRRLLVFQAGHDVRADGAGQPRDRVALGRAGDRRGGLPQPAAGLDGRRAARCTSTVTGLDVDGEPVRIEASGLEARVLQHEIDHLDGVLILDHAPRAQRKGALRALREGGSYSPPVDDEDEAAAKTRSIASRAPTREDRLPRHLELRRHGAAPPRRLAAPAAARHHPARPAQGPRTQDPAAAGRRGRARARASSCCQAESVSEGSALERIRAARPEAAVVCAFGQLIREPLLSELPILNVHPSLLPRWRGAAPIERAIMAGDERTGVSIMRLTEGLDSGPVALREEVAIGAEDDFEALSERLAGLGGELLGRALDLQAEGRLELEEQDDAAATYAEKIEPGERRLDPARPAAELARRVRALTPHVGAYLRARRGRAARRAAGARRSRPSWRRASCEERDGALLLGCGRGRAARWRSVQPAGGKPMAADAYLRGHPP